MTQDKVSVIYTQAVSGDKVDQAIEEAWIILLNRLEEDDFTILTQKDILGAVSSILKPSAGNNVQFKVDGVKLRQ